MNPEAENPDTVTRIALLTDQSRRSLTLLPEETDINRDGGQFEIVVDDHAIERNGYDAGDLAAADTVVAYHFETLAGHGSLVGVEPRDLAERTIIRVDDPLYLNHDELPDHVDPAEV